MKQAIRECDVVLSVGAEAWQNSTGAQGDVSVGSDFTIDEKAE